MTAFPHYVWAAVIKTKEHSNVSPAEWTSVPMLMHRLRARLAETLKSTGGKLRLIRHTSQPSSDALVAGSDVTDCSTLS